MRAFKLLEWGQPGRIVDAPKPVIAPGEVLIKVRAVGLCRSDLDMMDSKPGEKPYASSLEPGFILGHETAGWIEELGEGVTDLKKGESVVVHHMRHCGNCDFCTDGIEQHCEFYKRGDVGMTRGCGFDGGLAEFLACPRTEVISIGNSDPINFAPLTDAAITAYHAVQTFVHRIRPGSTAAVIGIGGLGSYGIQFLKLLSPAKIFAIDRSQKCLNLAKELGADVNLVSDASTEEAIMKETDGKGIDFIIDFVGNNQTLKLATRVSKPQGRIVVVGMDMGKVEVGWSCIGTSCEFAVSLGSTRKDLKEVCLLAAEGKLRIDVQRFSFDQIPDAYEKLRNGELTGRAVIVQD